MVGRGRSRSLSLRLNQPIRAGRLLSISAFSLRGGGADGTFGTADDVSVPLARLSYQARARTITLNFARPSQAGTMQLVVAAAGVVDLAGQRLDGDGDGTPGGDYVAVLNVR